MVFFLVLVFPFGFMVAATLGIIRFDQTARAKRRAADPQALPNFNEPDFLMLVGLTILCNLLALPYYFYATRQKASGAMIGILLLGVVILGTMILSTIMQVICRAAGIL